MNKQYAKDITIEVWDYFSEHPEIRAEVDLPDDLWVKIKNLFGECPFCEIFRPNGKTLFDFEPDEYLAGCPGCPLSESGHHCSKYESYYRIWLRSTTRDDASKAAKGIADIARAWDVGEKE